MVIAVPRSILRQMSCSPTKYRGRRELSEDVVLFSAKGPIHFSREKREELEQRSGYVKRGEWGWMDEWVSGELLDIYSESVFRLAFVA